ncbi:MAG: adenine phosphoribosyltransferase, partial [Prevotella salivae]|nr:adenine phosphoribosyltransferase [Segatella salivae]
CNLVKKFKPKKIYCNFIIELSSEFPNSRALFDKDIEISSLLQF